MKKIFKYGRYTYEYVLIQETRKTISLTVTPDFEMIVKCPTNLSIKKVESFLARKWPWIERQKRFFAQFRRSPKTKEHVSGESFYYLGRQYKLIVQRGRSTDVKLKKGKLHLTTNQGASNTKASKSILNNWFKQRSKVVFQNQLEKLFKEFDYTCPIPELEVKNMSKRWGSFLGKKKIILHPKLIHAPKSCIDYVIIHELCHFKYKNHTSAFYRLLTDMCPNWTSLKQELETKYL